MCLYCDDKSFFNKYIERKRKSECTAGGGYLQYTVCRCKQCNKEWEENI